MIKKVFTFIGVVASAATITAGAHAATLFDNVQNGSEIHTLNGFTRSMSPVAGTPFSSTLRDDFVAGKDWTITGLEFGFNSVFGGDRDFAIDILDDSLNVVHSVTRTFSVDSSFAPTRPEVTADGAYFHKASLNDLALDITSGIYNLAIRSLSTDVNGLFGIANTGNAAGTQNNAVSIFDTTGNVRTITGADANLDFTIFGTANSVSAVPVPAALPLMISGLIGLGLLGRRRKNAA